MIARISLRSPYLLPSSTGTLHALGFWWMMLIIHIHGDDRVLLSSPVPSLQCMERGESFEYGS
jgi:hypothetical protein